MQRLLFARIELWLVMALAILGLAGTILFGAAVLMAERTEEEPGPLTGTAHRLAETPLTALTLWRAKDDRRALHVAKLGERSGWTLADGAKGLAGEDYLLLSRFDGARDQALVELVDLRDMGVVHTWAPDAEALFQGVPANADLAAKWNRHYFEAVHPLPLPDGGLILKDHYTPLFAIDACGKRLWAEGTNIYHHSTEAAADGTLWVPAHLMPAKPIYGAHFTEDALARLGADGTLIEIHSLVDIYQRHGLMAQLFGAGAYDDDPIHLNDIQPVLADGPHWRKGDLFLSMRRTSTVMLYRPATDEILWRQQGPWMGQHDVDILDDHRIAIFNNNAINRGRGPEVVGANEVLVYDFATGAISSPYKQALADLQAETHSEGLDDLTSQGNLMVEEENTGRIMILTPDGRQLAEYVNRAANGMVYTTSWSRVIDRATGDRLRQVLAGVSCGG